MKRRCTITIEETRDHRLVVLANIPPAAENTAGADLAAKLLEHADILMNRSVVLAHAPACPVSQPNFVPREGTIACTCDFMKRLSELTL